MSSKEKIIKVIYGRVITFDKQNHKVEAIGIDECGKIAFVGSKNEIKKLIDNNTKVIDYGSNYIYPGFVDGHTHPGMLGSAITNGCSCDTSMKNKEVLKKFNEYIAKHPKQKIYKCYGSYASNKFGNKDYHFNFKMMDSALTNLKGKKAVVIITDYGGHSICLNGYSLKLLKKWVYLDTDIVKKYSLTDVIELADVNGDGNEIIDGNLCETPAYYLLYIIPNDLQELKKSILIQQNRMLAKMGYTTVGDCGICQNRIPCVRALGELAKEGKLKMKIRAYFNIFETDIKSAKKQVKTAIKLAKKYNSEYFKIIGLKIFIDGVSEKETCYTLKNYEVNPYPHDFPKGYRGIFRWSDSIRQIFGDGPDLRDIIVEANKNGLSVTAHAFGDGAVHYMLDKYEEARRVIKFDRNSIAHCAYVDDNDIKRFRDLHVIPLVAPHWAARFKTSDTHEIRIFGDDDIKHRKRNFTKMYKIKTFLDVVGEDRVSFHTDGMCPDGVPYMLYTAINRVEPNNADPKKSTYLGPRDKNEKITPKQAFRCLLNNPAYLLGEEDTIGSIEIGKWADLSIYPVDFTNPNNLKQENCKVAHTPLLATYVNGKLMYSKNKQSKKA